MLTSETSLGGRARPGQGSVAIQWEEQRCHCLDMLLRLSTQNPVQTCSVCKSQLVGRTESWDKAPSVFLCLYFHFFHTRATEWNFMLLWLYLFTFCPDKFRSLDLRRLILQPQANAAGAKVPCLSFHKGLA